MSLLEPSQDDRKILRKPVLGYYVANASAPPSEPRRVVPINPEQQKKVERLFHKIAEAP